MFDESKKKEIPFLPESIGIATSSTGAAIRDILKSTLERFPTVHIIIYPCSVQGKNAHFEIIEAIEYFNRTREVDVMVIGRGGGSIEDLWPFNEESLARAIFKSEIPIVSAVGHEIDYTIADFVADKRAPTPSFVGRLVVPDKEELSLKIESYLSGLILNIKNLIYLKKLFLENLQKRFYSPKKMIENYYLKIDELNNNLVFKIKSILDNKRKIFLALSGKLDALSPLGILNRGYSIATRLVDKKIVSSMNLVNIHDKINVTLKDGNLICEIEEKKENTIIS